MAGDTLEIGGRSFDVLTGNGHAPEQVMLYCAADKLFLAADQVLAKITPNISVWAVEPDGDPLGLYLRSLRELKAQIPADVLVLPGHQLPFYGLHTRSDELIAHHELRCAMIAEACRLAPRTAADLVPILFHRHLDPHQMSFAFSEAHGARQPHAAPGRAGLGAGQRRGRARHRPRLSFLRARTSPSRGPAVVDRKRCRVQFLLKHQPYAVAYTHHQPASFAPGA